MLSKKNFFNLLALCVNQLERVIEATSDDAVRASPLERADSTRAVDLALRSDHCGPSLLSLIGQPLLCLCSPLPKYGLIQLPNQYPLLLHACGHGVLLLALTACANDTPSAYVLIVHRILTDCLESFCPSIFLLPFSQHHVCVLLGGLVANDVRDLTDFQLWLWLPRE